MASSTGQNAVFDLGLDSNALTESANASIKSLQQLSDEIAAGTKEINQMQRASRLLKAGGAETAEQSKALTAEIKAQSAALAQSQAAYITQGGALADIGKKVPVVTEEVKKLTGTVDIAALATEKHATAWEKFAGVVGGKTAQSLRVITAAFAAVTVAALAAVGALLKYGLASADARRSELLRLEGLTKVRNWWGIAAGNAKEMQASLDRVSESTAGAREETARYQQQLYQAGLRGAALGDALEAMAITASTQGEAQAQVFAGWATAIGRTGGSVKKLSDDVKARLGGIAARQMLSLTVLSKKFGEVTSKLFDDLDIEPLGKAVQAIVKLFSQSTASGRALKTLLTSMLQPFVRSITSAAKTGRAFFLGMVYGALKLESAILSVLLWWKRTFGLPAVKQVDDAADAFDRGATAIQAAAAALVIFGPLLAGLALLGTIALVLKLAVAFWALVAPVWAVVAATASWVVVAAPLVLWLALIVAAVVLVIEIFHQLYLLWKEIDWTDLGKAIWAGITSAFDNVTEWFTDLAHGISKTFKDALGISSPSKVFAAYGEAIGDGLQQGINATKPEVNSSVETLIKPPKLDVPASSSGGPKQAGTTIQVGGINIVIEPRDGEDPSATGKRMGDAFVERLTTLLRGVNDQLGGGEVAT
jgi:hypothetical protein